MVSRREELQTIHPEKVKKVVTRPLNVKFQKTFRKYRKSVDEHIRLSAEMQQLDREMERETEGIRELNRARKAKWSDKNPSQRDIQLAKLDQQIESYNIIAKKGSMFHRMDQLHIPAYEQEKTMLKLHKQSELAEDDKNWEDRKRMNPGMSFGELMQLPRVPRHMMETNTYRQADRIPYWKFPSDSWWNEL